MCLLGGLPEVPHLVWKMAVAALRRLSSSPGGDIGNFFLMSEVA